MNHLTVGILLGIWLTISAAGLLIGFLMLGFTFLPPINTFTVTVVYLPWLIVGVLLAINAFRQAKSHD